MDDTWRKVRGTKVSKDGSAIQLAMETVDGRTMVVQLVPEAVSLLLAELANAKTKAALEATGGKEEVSPLDPTVMRQPIAASKLVLTNYSDRDGSLVQVLTHGGGVFEFVVPNDGIVGRKAG